MLNSQFENHDLPTKALTQVRIFTSFSWRLNLQGTILSPFSFYNNLNLTICRFTFKIASCPKTVSSSIKTEISNGNHTRGKFFDCRNTEGLEPKRRLNQWRFLRGETWLTLKKSNCQSSKIQTLMKRMRWTMWAKTQVRELTCRLQVLQESLRQILTGRQLTVFHQSLFPTKKGWLQLTWLFNNRRTRATYNTSQSLTDSRITSTLRTLPTPSVRLILKEWFHLNSTCNMMLLRNTKTFQVLIWNLNMVR